jgi:hypothetical protein
MNLKKQFEENAIVFLLALVASTFLAGFWVGREFLKNDIASGKSQLLVENGALRDKIQQNEMRIRELLAESGKKIKDCEQHVADMSDQLLAQKNQHESEIRRSRKTISDLRNLSKSQLRSSNQPQSDQSQKEPGKSETKSVTHAPTAQVDNFIFEALRCIKKGKLIYVEIRITNSSTSEENLALVASTPSPGYTGDPIQSYLYDARGIRYIANRIQLGNQTGQDQAEQKLLPGVSVIGCFWFENVQTEMDKVNIQLAALSGRFIFQSRFKVLLRDVPVELTP